MGDAQMAASNTIDAAALGDPVHGVEKETFLPDGSKFVQFNGERFYALVKSPNSEWTTYLLVIAYGV